MSAPTLFDLTTLAARRKRAASAPVDFLLKHVIADMGDRLSLVNRGFAAPVLIGLNPEPAGVLLGEELARALPTASIGENSALALEPARHDLIVSALDLQFINDLSGLFAQVRQALKPDGLFLAALIGGATLTELRQSFAEAEAEVEGGVSPRVAPFADVRDMGGLLQRAGLALPVTDSEALTVRYDNAFALMADLRAMGATNVLAARRRTPTRRATMLRMAQIYQERFADPDGRIRATFEILWVSGWAPHSSQQKPLEPGSAKQRLADALGVPERKE